MKQGNYTEEIEKDTTQLSKDTYHLNNDTYQHQVYKDQLEATLDLLPDESITIAEQLIEEIIFMREVLDGIKIELMNEGSVSLFKNGAQTNTRQTPEFKTYMDLSNRYKQYLKELKDLYPKNEVDNLELDPRAEMLKDFMSN